MGEVAWGDSCSRLRYPISGGGSPYSAGSHYHDPPIPRAVQRQSRQVQCQNCRPLLGFITAQGLVRKTGTLLERDVDQQQGSSLGGRSLQARGRCRRAGGRNNQGPPASSHYLLWQTPSLHAVGNFAEARLLLLDPPIVVASSSGF